MPAYLITYDLNKTGQDYKKLYDLIKELGSWCHYMDSTWIINTSLSPNQIVKHLESAFDSNDRLFVVEIKKNYQGLLTEEQWKFINESIF